mmetsp:Transcript_54304/g.115887  ORF Transcript_54304/g.115887 Transcript_54304/m.115887 type:complete len:285 (-) Transcript_54304:634-1488(-)
MLAPLLPPAILRRSSARLPIRARSAGLVSTPVSQPSPGGGAVPTPTPTPTATPTPMSLMGGSCSNRRRHPGGGSCSASRRQCRGHSGSRRGRPRVRFASPEWNTTFEVTPYEEFYGQHPNSFNFDANGNMVAVSPMGFDSPLDVSPLVASPAANTSSTTPRQSEHSRKLQWPSPSVDGPGEHEATPPKPQRPHSSLPPFPELINPDTVGRDKPMSPSPSHSSPVPVSAAAMHAAASAASLEMICSPQTRRASASAGAASFSPKSFPKLPEQAWKTRPGVGSMLP